MRDNAAAEWAKARLGDHAIVKARLGWKGLKAEEYVHDGPIFLAAPNLRRGRIDFDNVDHLPQWRYDESPEIQLAPGDVLLVKDGSTLGMAGFVKDLPAPTTVNGSIAVIRPRSSLCSGFLYQSINGRDFQRLIWLKRSGLGVPHVFQADLREFEISLPPRSEQEQIAHVFSTLDDAIEQSEALIRKHHQLKTGLMHDLFARGLRSDGKLRPSRNNRPDLYKRTSIGHFPVNWQIRPLGELAEIISGVTLGSEEDDENGVEVPYLRVANVQDGYLDLTEVKTIRIPSSLAQMLLLRRGDVLMNEGGDFDKLGRGTVWNEEIIPCVHQNHVFRVRPHAGRIRSLFLALYSQSEVAKRYFVVSSKQSTNLASINSTQLKRFPVAVPDEDEQQRIEGRITEAIQSIALLEAETRKLRQVKSGLLHDLLTGRVRVNIAEAAAR